MIIILIINKCKEIKKLSNNHLFEYFSLNEMKISLQVKYKFKIKN